MKKLLATAAALTVATVAAAAWAAQTGTEPSPSGDQKTELSEAATRGFAQPERAEPAEDRWAHAMELERQSHVRLRRAETALALIEERLQKMLSAEQRRREEKKADSARVATREETLGKLADVYTKMKVEQAGQVLEQFDAETASEVLALMEAKRAAKIITAMSPKRAAELLTLWTKRRVK